MKAIRLALDWIKDPFDVGATLDLGSQVLCRFPPTHVYAWLHAATTPDADYLKYLTREPVNTEALARLPDGTLGRSYIDMLNQLGINPLVRGRSYLLDVEPWPLARMFKVHDLQHLVTGIWPESQPQEGKLQGFLMGTLKPDFFAIASCVGFPFIVAASRPRRASLRGLFKGMRRGFALSRFQDFLMFPYEAYMALPLTLVRAELGIPPEGVGG